ncbi:hypothetical protein P5673_023708 [Acropora cervicornis]|uniref:Uncharacterized protein n=1 Tax=Acropora cervicornis TaxID=6130 RepID=A0AAD9Q4T4_ACRCE|nr:hypothetical protein P5673_023708 [Acropora cervicornis]
MKQSHQLKRNPPVEQALLRAAGKERFLGIYCPKVIPVLTKHSKTHKTKSKFSSTVVASIEATLPYLNEPRITKVETTAFVIIDPQSSIADPWSLMPDALFLISDPAFPSNQPC